MLFKKSDKKNGIDPIKHSVENIPKDIPVNIPKDVSKDAPKDNPSKQVHHHFLDKPTGLESANIPKSKFKFDMKKLFNFKNIKKKPAPFSRYDKKKKVKRKLVDILYHYLDRSGYEVNPRDLIKKVLFFDMQLVAVISMFILIIALANSASIVSLLTFLVIVWTLIFAAIFLLSVAMVLGYLDIRLYKNTKQIEENLPDFLQLASANISAGMTVDRALWFAIRPKFGILATEIEEVAKATLAGEELEKALLRLSKKYDSRILRESINLLVAGISSGGEIAELLNKISANIKDTSLMKKEIAASVTTYVIFIGVATVIAAPILFALSTQLLIVIKTITSNIHVDNSSGMSGLFSFNFSGDSISIDTFQKFAILVIAMSSFFSAAIISAIRKGTIKEGFKLMPLFMIISVLLYILASSFFSTLLGSVIK